MQAPACATGAVERAPFIFGRELSRGVYTVLCSETGHASVAKIATPMELDRLRSLPPHPHIVAFLGVFVRAEDGLAYLQTELLEMNSLHATVRNFGPLPEPLVASFTAQALLALHHLHALGVTHGDVKAANLLLSKEGVVKLCDFGGGGAAAAQLSSAAWLAPECARGEPPSPAGDVWALGITALELLLGAPPLAALPAAAAVFAIGSARDGPPLPAGLSPAARAFLAAALERDPSRRAAAAALLRQQWVADAVARLQRLGAPHSARLGEAVAAVIAGGGGAAGEGVAGSGGSKGGSESDSGREAGSEGGSGSDGDSGSEPLFPPVTPAIVPRLLLPPAPLAGALELYSPPPRESAEWEREWRPLALRCE